MVCNHRSGIVIIITCLALARKATTFTKKKEKESDHKKLGLYSKYNEWFWMVTHQSKGDKRADNSSNRVNENNMHLGSSINNGKPHSNTSTATIKKNQKQIHIPSTI